MAHALRSFLLRQTTGAVISSHSPALSGSIRFSSSSLIDHLVNSLEKPKRRPRRDLRTGEITRVARDHGVLAARELYEDLKLDGLVPSLELFHTLLRLEFSRPFPYPDMHLQEMFQEMKDFGIVPNQTTFDLLLTSSVHSKDPNFPFIVWEELKSRKDIRPGRDAIAAILRICSSNRLLVGRATSIQAQMNQSNTKPNSAIYAAIIHCFRARGMLSEAPSPVTYNAVIHLCAELGALAEAEELEEDLDGLYGTNSYSLGCIFLGYILNGQYESSLEVLGVFKKRRWRMPMMIMTDMVRKLSLQGVQGTRLAEQVLIEMETSFVLTVHPYYWRALLAEYLGYKKFDDAKRLMRKLSSTGKLNQRVRNLTQDTIRRIETISGQEDYEEKG